jgi:hypothetical protein
VSTNTPNLLLSGEVELSNVVTSSCSWILPLKPDLSWFERMRVSSKGESITEPLSAVSRYFSLPGGSAAVSERYAAHE